MQAISVSEARQNFKKYCEDVIDSNDVIIVSRNGNGKENMVWMDLGLYNELQKAKDELEGIINFENNEKQITEEKNIIRTAKETETMEDE